MHGNVPRALWFRAAPSRFNGAMLYQAWKLARARSLQYATPRASMEPCFIKHGNLKWNELTQTQQVLQWSHALSSMETTRPKAHCCPTRRLQWSHALSSMETPFVPGCKSGVRVPLQWSHALSSMETRHQGIHGRRRTGLASMEPCFIKHGNLQVGVKWFLPG